MIDAMTLGLPFSNSDNPTLSLAVRSIRPDAVIIPAGRRAAKEETVVALMESFRVIGQQTPVTVRQGENGFVLVAGLHRLLAAKRLGMDLGIILLTDAYDPEDWEIAENLHRADLTGAERDALIVRWAEKRKAGEIASIGSVAPIESKRADGRGHRPQGGVRQLARELGIPKDTVRRALAKAAEPEPEPEQAPAAAKPSPFDPVKPVQDEAAAQGEQFGLWLRERMEAGEAPWLADLVEAMRSPVARTAALKALRA